MKKAPLIIWEKWNDPILNNLSSQTSLTDMLDEDADPEPYEESAYEAEPPHPIINKYPIIITPMGILPYCEKTACDTIFNFWVGHTNFSITKNIAALLENTDGVETLDIFTRYRFRVGIGKAFKDSKVMRNINSVLYGYINE